MKNLNNTRTLTNKKSILLYIVLLISAFFLFHSFKGLEYDKLSNALSNTKIKYILLWLLYLVIGTLIRSIRWKFILNDKSIKLTDLFHSLNIGNFASMILPFRAGEFVRPYYLNEWTKIGFSRAFISVILERVFDVIGMFLLFYLYVSQIKDLPSIILISAKSLSFLAIILVITMIASRFMPKLIEGIFDFFIKFLPAAISKNLKSLFTEIISALASIKTLPQLIIITVLTLALWWTYAYSFALILSALGAQTIIEQGAVISVFVALAIAAPNAPGFLLTFELGCTAALAVFSYGKEFSLAFAIIAHALQFFSIILIGIISLLSKGLSLSSLNHKR